MKVFISGGCKSGKSDYAEKISVRLASRAKPLYYVATMAPADEEDEARIALHREKRAGAGFETIELSRGIADLADRCDAGGTFLIDSLTALLANEMFLPDGGIDGAASEKIIAGLGELFLRLNNMVIVSDYIYSDAACFDALTIQYRNGLAAIDRFCAKACDAVAEAFCGAFMIYKGKGALDEVF